MRLLFLLLAICISSLNVTAQTEDSITIRRIANNILINGQAYENLRYLCKKIGPRLSGSSNAQKAVEARGQSLQRLPP